MTEGSVLYARGLITGKYIDHLSATPRKSGPPGIVSKRILEIERILQQGPSPPVQFIHRDF